MALESRPARAHAPVVGRTHEFNWRIEHEWTCPYHDQPLYVSEETEDGGPGEICNICEHSATWRPKVDEEGWMTLTFTEKTAMDYILQDYAQQVRQYLNEPSILLGMLND